MNRASAFASILLSLVLACGDDDGTSVPIDSGTDAGLDAGGDAGRDAGSDDDAGADDAGFDAGGDDAGADAGGDDAGLGTRDAGSDTCHSLDFGADEVALRRVDSLPTMTGGTIPDGIYDAVDYQTTGGATGAYRGTWSIRSTGAGVGTMDVIQQLTLTGVGPIVPRTLSWTASGTALARTETCPNEGAMTNFTYSVVTEGGVTRLLARSASVLFVLERR